MKFTSTLAAAALLLAATACNSESKLAQNVEGQWAANPEQILQTDASMASIIETFTFAPSDSIENGGNATLAALVSVTGSISGVQGISQPLNMTASGYASVQGSWSASSGSQLSINFKPENVVVTIDPNAVVLASPENSSPIPVDVKGNLASSIKTQIEKALRERYAPNMTFTDVKFSDDAQTMTYKLTGKECSLRRQQP